MTQKELLYVEDAIGHEKSIIGIINESLEYLKDKNLIRFLLKELKKHEMMEEKLMNLLEDSANE